MKSYYKKIAATAFALLLGFTFVFTGCSKKAPAPQGEVSISQSTQEESAPSNAAERPTPTVEDFDPLNFGGSIEIFETTYPKAVVTSVEYMVLRDGITLEVEGLGQKEEFEILINEFGETLSYKSESADFDATAEMKAEGFSVDDLAALITPEQAYTAALTVKEGELRSIHLEKEHGSFQYEVELVSSNQDWEITLDAVSGEVIKIDD